MQGNSFSASCSRSGDMNRCVLKDDVISFNMFSITKVILQCTLASNPQSVSQHKQYSSERIKFWQNTVDKLTGLISLLVDLTNWVPGMGLPKTIKSQRPLLSLIFHLTGWLPYGFVVIDIKFAIEAFLAKRAHGTVVSTVTWGDKIKRSLVA